MSGLCVIYHCLHQLVILCVINSTNWVDYVSYITAYTNMSYYVSSIVLIESSTCRQTVFRRSRLVCLYYLYFNNQRASKDTLYVLHLNIYEWDFVNNVLCKFRCATFVDLYDWFWKYFDNLKLNYYFFLIYEGSQQLRGND